MRFPTLFYSVEVGKYISRQKDWKARQFLEQFLEQFLGGKKTFLQFCTKSYSDGEQALLNENFHG